MKEKELDELLHQLSRRQIPSMTEHLESRVWNEIQRRKKSDSSLGWVFDLLPMPYTAFASLIIAGLVGFSFGMVDATIARSVSTRGALELQVFSSSAPNLPSTLLESSS